MKFIISGTNRVTLGKLLLLNGSAQVHLVGGVAGNVATLYLKPRQNRFGEAGSQQLSNPSNAVLGNSFPGFQ